MTTSTIITLLTFTTVIALASFILSIILIIKFLRLQKFEDATVKEINRVDNNTKFNNKLITEGKDKINLGAISKIANQIMEELDDMKFDTDGNLIQESTEDKSVPDSVNKY